MRLTNKQIISCAAGSVNTKIIDDRIIFGKCTDKQIAAFSSLSPTLGERSRATTGIRLDFHTNSPRVSFFASKGVKFDVAINGLLVKQFNMKEQKEKGSPATLEIVPPSDKAIGDDARVTIYFPSHSESGVIDYVELCDGSTFSPHTFDRKFLFIGDSITQGWNTKYDSLSFALHLSEMYNAESVVNGIGGAYFHESIFDVPNFDPDAVFVAYGTNDFSHFGTLSELEYHAKSFFDNLKREYLDNGKKVIYISPITRFDREHDKPMGSFAALRSLLIGLATERGFFHADGITLVPPIKELFADAVHPNDAGFLHYAASLYAATSEYLG